MMRDRIETTIAMLTAGMGLAVLISIPVAQRGTAAVATESQTISEQQRLIDAGINPATLNACYRLGTPIEVIERIERERFGGRRNFTNGGRWSTTATDGPTGTPGTPITLTYSFPPDGWFSFFGDENIIRETLNAQFGSESAWKAKFREIFDTRSAGTGITYVYEPSDDGAPDGAPGQLGTRGDMRIIMAPLPPGLLGFAFFPDDGEMTLNSIEPWSSQPQLFTNVVAHEAGHSFGAAHVGPLNETKLMEPFLSVAFDGPQDDDIRGTIASYGDTMELNDTAGSAADLGAYSPGAVFGGLALGGNDEDWFALSAGSGQLVAASVRPIGATYLVGPDGGPFGSISTQSIMPLGIEIYDQTGVDLLRTTVNTVAGGIASSVPVAVPDGNSRFLVRVFTEGGGDVQRYELKLPSAVSEPAILSIESVGADGIDVSASPADGVGVSMLTSPGQLIYARGQSVTLSVPSSAEGVQFIQWLIGGDAQTPGQTEATFSVSGDTTITAIFADAPTINAGPAKTIVVGESVQLEGSATGGSPPYTFSWEPSAGVIDADTATPTVSPTKSTDYSMTVVDSNGTTVIDAVRVEVLPALRADAGANQFTINGGSFALTGSATGAVEPYSFAWTPATLLSEPNQSLTRGSLSETTDFTLTVTDADGRKAASVVKVVVVGSIVVNVGEDVQIRPGQSMRLTAKITGGLPPYSVQWTPAFLATTVTTRSVLVKPQEDTTFGVLVTDALGQEGRDTVAVSLAAPLSVTASARPGSVLLGESTTLVGAVSGGVPPFEYTWGPDGDVADLHAQQSELTPSVTRTYGLNVRDSLGQTGAASVRVVVVRPEQAINTQSALQAPEVSATPTLLPTCGAGLLGVLPLMAASMMPFRRRRLRRA